MKYEIDSLIEGDPRPVSAPPRRLNPPSGESEAPTQRSEKPGIRRGGAEDAEWRRTHLTHVKDFKRLRYDLPATDMRGSAELHRAPEPSRFPGDKSRSVLIELCFVSSHEELTVMLEAVPTDAAGMMYHAFVRHVDEHYSTVDGAHVWLSDQAKAEDAAAELAQAVQAKGWRCE